MEERCSVFWPYDFIGDRNRCFCETEKRANNVDSRWGQKDEFPYDEIADSWAESLEKYAKYKEYLKEMEALRRKFFARELAKTPCPPPPHHHEKPVIKEFSPDDVLEEYGYVEQNVVLMEQASARMARLIKALDITTKSSEVNLDQLNHIAPMSTQKMKEILIEYYNAEISNCESVISKANDYIFGNPPTPEPEPTPEEGNTEG